MIIYTDREALSKWDARFLALAEQVAAWSKGPRKRIGAVVVRPDKSIASLGYNGPPRDFDDEAFLRMSREDQHSVVIHAEDNALRQTHEAESVASYTLFVSPLLPCANCADKIAKAGIRRVVAYCGHISPDWRASAEEAERIFINAGVECLFMFEGEKMKHEDFSKYWLLRDDEGNVLSVNTEEAEAPKIIFTEGSVAPEWYNPLRAAGAMYNQLTAQYNALQDLIDVSETVTGPNNPIIRNFIELQNAILLTQQVAREGVENVAVMLDKQPKLP